MADSVIKIHLADDHQVLIDGLLAVLKLDPRFQVVGFSLDGVGLLDRIKENEADILIMDINMPETDGIEVLRTFRKEGFPCRVIILSSYEDVKLIREVIKLGADGFLAKNCAGEEISDAIENVYAGKQYFSESIRQRILGSFSGTPINEDRKYASIAEGLESITDRELEILKLIGQEYSGQEISDQLGISKNTVETHRKNLIKKLKVKNSIGLVKMALKYNLIN
ncbi:response regulator [Sungkyunkwania multivorans]|uniref:Response regulator n=1 Tax=Sungkyunkwania multivorans TaxID=1173618 RepID=A0ABW3CYN7_9FLAO